MELKHRYAVVLVFHGGLLIVPYGIETLLSRSFPMFLLLLIVPYGIETEPENSGSGYPALLIVPYGIETSTRHR